MSEKAKAAFHDAMERFGELLDAIPRAKRVRMFETMQSVEVRLRLGAIATQLLWRAWDELDKEGAKAQEVARDIHGFFAAFGEGVDE